MTDVISAVLLLSGGLIGVAGAIGLVRFPDVMSRVQAATKPQTFGLLLILAGAAVRLDAKAAAGLGLVALFQVITAPVLAQLLGRTAYRTGQVANLSRDDLDEPVHRRVAIGYPPQVTHYDESAPEPAIDDEAPVADALDQREATVAEPDPAPDRVPEREVSDVDAADQAIPVAFDEDDATVTGEEWDER
ncbi:MAG: hypothetical protein GEV04_22005 [Actinophytocola sp.]|nr:hypothetical protein [Actinophytocola sp.]